MSRRLSVSSLSLLLIVALMAALAPTMVQLPRAQAAGGPLTGAVFVDFDRDGRIDEGEQLDPNLVGVLVTAHDAVGGSVSATTTAGGAYSLNTGGLAGDQLRIEFETPSGYNPTFASAFGSSVPDSATSVQFIDTSIDTTDIVYGIVPDSECPVDGTGAPTANAAGGNVNVAEGKVWTTCFVNGAATDGSGPQDTLVGANYTASGYPGDIWDRDNTGGNPDAEHLSTKDVTGALWGVAYDEWDGQLFTSALVKRHVGLGPEGVDGLYWFTYQNGTGGWVATPSSVGLDSLSPGSAPSFGTDPTNCPTAGGTWDYTGWSAANMQPGGSYDCRDLGGPVDPSYDFWAFDRVGQYGIGDIDVTPDGNQLLVMNLTASTLFVYDITSGTPVYSDHIAITDPGCAGGDFQPWAVTSLDATRAYVGVTCTATTTQNVADLEAHIVEVSLTSGAQTSTATVPMDYDHGCGYTVECSAVNGNFQPWLDGLVFPSLADMGSVRFASWLSPPAYVISNTVGYEQPLLSDIEVDPFDGSLAIGIVSRWGLQTWRLQLRPQPHRWQWLRNADASTSRRRLRRRRR